MKKDSVRQAALDAGLNPNLVWKRINRGDDLEDALGPVRRRVTPKPEAQEKNRKQEEDTLQFFVEFTREHAGMPPDLPALQRGLGTQSITIGRGACFRLVDQGKLRAVENGKYIINGSRWLDPTENEALDRLIQFVKDIVEVTVATAEDDCPEMLDLVDTLTKRI